MSPRAGTFAALALVSITVVGFLVWTQRRDHAAPPRDDDPLVLEEKADFELAADTQKEIWDAEHIAFELEHTFGGPFKDAIRNGDRKRLTAFFRDEFSGSRLDFANGEQRQQSGIAEVRVENSSKPKSVTADEFADVLLTYAARFKKIESVGLRALDVRNPGDGRWTSRMLLTIAGIEEQDRWAEFESIQHVEFRFHEDRDLKTIPVITEWKVQSQKRRTSPRRLFVEVTEQVGLHRLPLADNWRLPSEKTRQYRFQSAVADFDRDGSLDIAVVDFERCYLLRRSTRDGQFNDCAGELGITLKPSAPGISLAGWLDYDNDGYPDLVLGNQLYHNERGRRFRNVTGSSGLKFKDHAMPMGIQVADYDGDGNLDLYVLYQSYGSGTKAGWINSQDDGEENQLWRNLGNGQFRDVTASSNASGGKRKSFAATWFFYDDDHWPDLYIANDFSKNVLLRNNGNGTFTDVSEISRAADFSTTMGVASGDTNNDGKTDIYVANMYSKMGRRILGHIDESDYPPGYYEQILGSCAGNRLYLRSSSDSGFEEVGSQLGVQGVGWAYAPAIADFDMDGYLDLYAATGFMSFDHKKPDG